MSGNQNGQTPESAVAKAGKPAVPRRQAAAKVADLLRESEERLRLAQAIADLGIWDLNLKTHELVWTPETCRLYGLEPDAQVGIYERWRQLVHPDDVDRVERDRRQAIEQGGPYSSECRIRFASGAIRWIASKGKVYFDADGTPARMLGVNIDITERKRAEESLRESQARLAGIVDTARDAIVSVNEAQRITLFNAGAEQMFGCPAAQALGQPLDRFIPAILRENHQRLFARSGEGSQSTRRMGVVTGLRANGEEFPIEASISQLELGEQKIFTVILRDITARVRALAELRKSEERARAQLAELQSIYASAPVGLAVFGPDLRCVRINERLAAINGIPPAAQIGKTLREVIPGLAETAEPLLQQVVKSGEPLLNVEIVGETIAQPGIKRTWLVSLLPLKNADGQVSEINMVVEEITDRKRLENELKEHALRLEEADRRKDEFIAMLAHELRNPLAPIRNALEVLGLCQSPDADFEWSRHVIDQQVTHLARLLDDLLDLSRITRNKLELKKKRTLLSDAVAAALEAIRPIIDQRNHQLSVAAPPDGIYLLADSVRLTQAFVNLINNAAKYTPPGGRILISTEKENGTAVVRVIDNGMGISAAQLPHIFDMFYQADRSYEQAYGGLGIGLTLVKRLIEMHDGSVEARSAGMNRGSEFIVRLPTLDGAEVIVREKGRSDVQASAARRILVVDDYPNAAESLAKWLRRFGNHVEVAFDGVQAIEVAQQFRPDVILLDIGMPKLNGYETARIIRQQSWGKQMVLVALTGWGQEEDRKRTREAGFDLHLVKPVEHAQLAAFLAKTPCGQVEGAASRAET
jgi:PAS domain S-box-containing protein